jgi:hypothetical protein
MWTYLREGPQVRRAGLGGALLLTAAALSGCGSGSGGSGAGGGSAPSTAAPPATTSLTATGKLTTHPPHRPGHAKPKPKAPKGPNGPPVGRAQDVITHGSHLTVTITHVIALTSTGSALLPGTRQVGVQLTIDNHGPQPYDSTASGDVSVVLSSGQAAPLDVRRGACETQLVDFESEIFAGDIRQGCVGFTVPRSAKIVAARFSPESRPPGTLTWRTAH